eukprot:6203775-Pleurochrysis_carterae.AAC.2
MSAPCSLLGWAACLSERRVGLFVCLHALSRAHARTNASAQSRTHAREIHTHTPHIVRACVTVSVCLRPWEQYKPTFGSVFEKYLKSYTHWGYCDLDMRFDSVEPFEGQSPKRRCAPKESSARILYAFYGISNNGVFDCLQAIGNLLVFMERPELEENDVVTCAHALVTKAPT